MRHLLICLHILYEWMWFEVLTYLNYEMRCLCGVWGIQTDTCHRSSYTQTTLSRFDSRFTKSNGSLLIDDQMRRNTYIGKERGQRKRYIYFLIHNEWSPLRILSLEPEEYPFMLELDDCRKLNRWEHKKEIGSALNLTLNQTNFKHINSGRSFSKMRQQIIHDDLIYLTNPTVADF